MFCDFMNFIHKISVLQHIFSIIRSKQKLFLLSHVVTKNDYKIWFKKLVANTLHQNMHSNLFYWAH